MQIDFHFHCVAVLARAAGFPVDDALTVAYASQYVDDATESEWIRVGDLYFEPVRTAHYGLRSYSWSTQKRVFIPFHFLPHQPIRDPKATFMTSPASPFCEDILDEASNEPDERFRLIRTGVALHTLADSWSHQGFSGCQDEENDVERIEMKENGRFERLWLENVYLDAAPKIGHAQAGHFPDQPWRTWRCRFPNRTKKKTVTRDNHRETMNAAESVYHRLVDTPITGRQPQIPWAEIRPRLNKMFRIVQVDADKRANRWLKAFNDLIPENRFRYDRLDWRSRALIPREDRDIEWDHRPPAWLEGRQFDAPDDFYQTDWVLFHRAALKQRHFVLERLL